MTKILVADDEGSIRALLSAVMRDEGFAVCEASNGFDAVEVFTRERPDLAVLDVMMPKVDGFDACERIRALNPSVPVLFLSAKGDIVDKKTGYRAGADDYMTKPFNEEELLLHVKALLRRCSGSGETIGERPGATVLDLGDLHFDFRSFELCRAGKRIDLTPKEFQVLALLARHPGQAFSREEIVETVWGESYDTASVSVAVYVRRIREKLEDDPSKPRYLKTVWRVGYLLDS